MFGDPGINPKKWPVKKLEEYIEYMGDIGSNGSNEMVAKNLEMLDVEDYAIMIRTTNLTRNDFTNNIKYVTQKTYDFFKKSKIYGGEIIMNKIGSAGDFWLMPKLNLPVTLGLNQLVIRPKNLPTLYLFHYLSTDYGRMIVKAQAKGATTKSITKTAVKALPLMSPPVELQNKFVAIVEKTEAIKTQYQQSLQELENLYGSLSKKAFRGELSIKDESLLMAAEPQAEYNKK
jgi:type I restriction enzyme S subunit